MRLPRDKKRTYPIIGNIIVSYLKFESYLNEINLSTECLEILYTQVVCFVTIDVT